uniref:U6 snRNA phosphodiesterase 1 n=1 Tax=Pfiesteria piscicida TaxID=71001 RepID=A3E3S4_PFIPI|nr:unknown [Pfiesteria piscicida]
MAPIVGIAHGGDDSESPSSSDSSGSASSPPRTRRRLTLPHALRGLEAPGPRDNSADHGGRYRRVPHVDGNFAAWIFLAVPSAAAWRRRSAGSAAVLRRLAGSSAEVHITSDASDGSALGCHVTLSPMLTLRRQFIDPLLAQLRRTLCTVRAADAVSTLQFSNEDWVFSSAECDRFFAGVLLEEASAAPLRHVAAALLLAASELCLTPQAPPTQEMLLHCSLAWTVADLRPGLEAAGAERFESSWGVAWRLRSAPVAESSPLEAPLSAVSVRVGERTTLLPLPWGRSFQDVKDSASSEDF